MRSRKPRARQIHRSHWVALDAIRSVGRKDGKLMVETNTGTFLSVSKTFQSGLKDAGYLR